MSCSNALPAPSTCSVSGERCMRAVFLNHSTFRRAAGSRLSRTPLGSNCRGGKCSCFVDPIQWIVARPALETAQRGLERPRGHRGHHRGEKTRAQALSVAKMAWTCALSVSALPPIVVQHSRISTLSCFRSATLQLVSCSRHFSGESLKQRDSKDRPQGSIVKALLGDPNFERDEARWMREEQRWLREEQRWQREETRWAAANQALQEEVTVLRKELEELRGQREHGGQIIDTSLKNLVTGMRSLLQALAAPGTEDSPLLSESLEALRQIPSTVSPPEEASTTYTIENSEAAGTPVTFVVSPDTISAVVTPPPETANTPSPVARSSTEVSPPPSQAAKGVKSKVPTNTKSKSLKTGMEGEDVKEMQDALAELGFYSGEEDMEYSTFSSSTASAVKTWQASRGLAEDGIVTAELMAVLLAEVVAKLSANDEGVMKKLSKSNSKLVTKVETPTETTQQTSSNPISREIDRYERSDAQETGSGSSRRVYLLGENRWEEPDRVRHKQNEARESKNGAINKMKVQMCFSCRGVGTMLCTDCEGTGDLNVEEQFLDWTEEDAKCPYCEGLGAVTCDVCNGETAVSMESTEV